MFQSSRAHCLALSMSTLVIFSSLAVGAAGSTVCEDPRPQMCTMDYRPVCGTLKDGSTKTYSNGCGACADAAVTSWVENACPE